MSAFTSVQRDGRLQPGTGQPAAPVNANPVPVPVPVPTFGEFRGFTVFPAGQRPPPVQVLPVPGRQGTETDDPFALIAKFKEDAAIGILPTEDHTNQLRAAVFGYLQSPAVMADPQKWAPVTLRANELIAAWRSMGHWAEMFDDPDLPQVPETAPHQSDAAPPQPTLTDTREGEAIETLIVAWTMRAFGGGKPSWEREALRAMLEGLESTPDRFGSGEARKLKNLAANLSAVWGPAETSPTDEASKRKAPPQASSPQVAKQRRLDSTTPHVRHSYEEALMRQLRALEGLSMRRWALNDLHVIAKNDAARSDDLLAYMDGMASSSAQSIFLEIRHWSEAGVDDKATAFFLLLGLQTGEVPRSSSLSADEIALILPPRWPAEIGDASRRQLVEKWETRRYPAGSMGDWVKQTILDRYGESSTRVIEEAPPQARPPVISLMPEPTQTAPLQWTFPRWYVPPSHLQPSSVPPLPTSLPIVPSQPEKAAAKPRLPSMSDALRKDYDALASMLETSLAAEPAEQKEQMQSLKSGFQAAAMTALRAGNVVAYRYIEARVIRWLTAQHKDRRLPLPRPGGDGFGLLFRAPPGLVLLLQQHQLEIASKLPRPQGGEVFSPLPPDNG